MDESYYRQLIEWINDLFGLIPYKSNNGHIVYGITEMVTSMHYITLPGLYASKESAIEEINKVMQGKGSY